MKPLICSINDDITGSFALLLFQNELDACRAFCFFLKDKEPFIWRNFKMMFYGYLSNDDVKKPCIISQGFNESNISIEPIVLVDGVACMDILLDPDNHSFDPMDWDSHEYQEILNTTELWHRSAK